MAASKAKAKAKKMTESKAKGKKMKNSKVKKMTKLQLNNIHKRLENGEHLLVADYGNINKDISNGELPNGDELYIDYGNRNKAIYGNRNKGIFSIWYEERSVGKCLIILAQNNETIAYCIDGHSTIWTKAISHPLEGGMEMDIRDFKGYNEAFSFLESECLEIQEDKLNQKQRLIKDYTDMLSLVTNEDKNKAPFINYQSELDRLIGESPEKEKKIKKTIEIQIKTLKRMTQSELNNIHKRLENGEHLLVADYGNINKDIPSAEFLNGEAFSVDYENRNKGIFSIWYEERSVGKCLTILAQNDATIAYCIDDHSTSWSKTVFYPLEGGMEMDIRDFKGYNEAFSFLESECLEIQKDKLNQKQRLIKDYTDLLSLVKSKYKNKALFIHYQSELDRLTKESEEYAI
jgi:hypothetical protein